MIRNRARQGHDAVIGKVCRLARRKLGDADALAAVAGGQDRFIDLAHRLLDRRIQMPPDDDVDE